MSASSVLRGKELVLDLSALADADEAGIELLSRMQDSGARVVAPNVYQPEELMRALGLTAASPAPKVTPPPASGWRKFLARLFSAPVLDRRAS